MMNDFWNGVNVLITGITGFVGGNIAKKLVELGANVHGLVRTSTYNSHLFFEKTNKKVALIDGKICDLNFKKIYLETNIRFLCNR